MTYARSQRTHPSKHTTSPQRCYNVAATCQDVQRRCKDVVVTLYVHWDAVSRAYFKSCAVWYSADCDLVRTSTRILTNPQQWDRHSAMYLRIHSARINIQLGETFKLNIQLCFAQANSKLCDRHSALYSNNAKYSRLVILLPEVFTFCRDILKTLWKRGEFPHFHNILLPVVRFSCLNRDQIFTSR